jgi:hypothetical protein
MSRIPTGGLLRSPPARAALRPLAPIADGADRQGRFGAVAATGPVRDRTLVAVLAVAVALTALGLARHAMWFDELQAWNLARASRSVPDLLHHLRYEGHPPAWYLVLYGLTRITGDPRAMQGAELVIVAATYVVVLFASPFSKPVRFALLAGYTISFEYGVISRGYGLGVLSLVVTLALLGRPRPRWRWALLSAAVLAWTSVAGAVVALAIAGAVASGARCRGGRRTPGPGRDRRRFVAGTGVAAVAAAVVCIPPSDFHAFTPSVGSVSTLGTAGWTRLLTAATGTWRGLVPIPSRLGAWNSQFVDRLPAAAWIEAGLSIAVVALMAGALRRFRTARRLWLLGSVGSFLFFAVVVLPDQARYAGTTFLVFLGAAWWAFAPPGGPDDGSAGEVAPGSARSSRRLQQLVTVVIAAQVVALVAIYPLDASGRFAPNQAVADVVRAAGLQDHVVSGQDFDATSVAAYLDRPVYSVARQAWIRYFIHDDREARRYNALRAAEILCAAWRVARGAHHAAAIITEHPLAGGEPGVARIVTIDHVEVIRVDPDATLAGCADPASRSDANVIVGGDDIFLARLTGPGPVWLQTLPLPKLAGALLPYLPQPPSESKGGGLVSSILDNS